MERFLSQCAKYIYKKHAAELHNICLVFPNRRSGVFFNSYLQNEISGAVIAPETTTIGELISGYSDFFQAERLQLISVLYDVFQNTPKQPKHLMNSISGEKFCLPILTISTDTL
jgi:hypothetical protein